MLDLRLLLEEMTMRFPPGVNQAHRIELATVPGALRLTLIQDKVMLDLILGHADMYEKTLDAVRDEILAILIAEGYATEAKSA